MVFPPLTVRPAAEQPAITWEVTLSTKLTVPERATAPLGFGVIVAVKVTELLTTEGFCEELRETVVEAGLTV